MPDMTSSKVPSGSRTVTAGETVTLKGTTKDGKTVTIKGSMPMPKEVRDAVRTFGMGDISPSIGKRRIDGHLDYEGTHPSVVIEGWNPIYGPYAIKCDTGISDFIRKLNNLGYGTIWSCQGDEKGQGPDGGYLVMDMPELKDYSRLHKLVTGYWSDKYVTIEILPYDVPQVVFRAYWKLDRGMQCNFIHRPPHAVRRQRNREARYLDRVAENSHPAPQRTYHPQTTVSGVNPKYGSYSISCDEKMADVIRKINDLGVKTCWSCQGNDHDDDHAAYLVTEYLTQRNFRNVIRILEKHWRDRYIHLEVDGQKPMTMTFRAHHHVPHDPVDTTYVAMPCIYLHRPDDQTRWDGSEWKEGGGHVQ